MSIMKHGIGLAAVLELQYKVQRRLAASQGSESGEFMLAARCECGKGSFFSEKIVTDNPILV